mmetsp:Transcript_17828/g.40912  ORF Transcript_17828/g.40912 Transcript_17828/m.40912 type:complete len:721 (+) Transcript_17828:185-2347(+)
MADIQHSKKRDRPSKDDGGCENDGDKLTKRQRKALASKKPYFQPKPASALQRLEVPLDEMAPEQRIDLIADLSESIIEDPATALTSSRTALGASGNKSSKDGEGAKEKQYQKTQSKMNRLLDLASLSSNGHDAHAARLGILSLLAIFQDILPSYRIRLPTEAEMSVRVSKDVKQTWDYERKLLQAYQRYLQLLERTWEEGKFGRNWSSLNDEKRKQHQPPTTIAATAILALSQLLQSCYNFNFRSNLIAIVVKQASNKNEDIRLACCSALSSMFANKDMQGEASLEAVRLMAKLIKQQSTNGGKPVHSDLVNTWLSLPLRVHEDEAVAARLAAQAKLKKSKRSKQDKEQADIEKEMKEGEASVDKMELARNQNECLHSITLTYFRILKEVASEKEDSRGGGDLVDVLLPCALNGLAKFSHLIHLDAIVDLLSVLKELLKNVDVLPLDAAIHCVLCALKTLRGPGRDTLPVDPKEYLVPLYSLLPRLGVDHIEAASSVAGTSAVERGGDRTIEAAIQCLDHAFLQRRELSTKRLSGFVKRLTSTSLHCSPQSAVPLLASARQVSARYSSAPSSKLGCMLENEEEIVSEGVYAPESEDPEQSNAHATSLWELSLLRHSMNPLVSSHAQAAAEGKLLRLPGETPKKLFARMSRNAMELYIPQKVQWKRHPLDSRPKQGEAEEGVRVKVTDIRCSESKRRRRQRNLIRFITPRRTEVKAVNVFL